MWHQIDLHFAPRPARRRRPQRQRPLEPRLETLEDRAVPAGAGASQLAAAQSITAVAVTAEAAFEANYKVFSQTATVYELANLISAFLHSEQEGLTGTMSIPQQNPLASAVMNQTIGYVTQEISSLESWYFNVTSGNVAVQTVLNQLSAFTLSFQQTEVNATPVQVTELTTGVITTSTAFNYIPPGFINPGGVATPSGASIIDPPHTISVMNNNQISQYVSVSSNAQFTTTTTITPAVAQPVHGVPFNVAVTVGPVLAGGTVPTGQVILTLDGSSLGPVTLNNQGTASFVVSVPTAGTHVLTAIYLGDTTYQPSNNTLTLTVT